MRLRWTDLVRDIGAAVAVAVVIGLICQYVAGHRPSLFSQSAFALAGIWAGRAIARAWARTSKNKQTAGRTGSGSDARDANKPRD